jgi:hypothetical protein
MRIRFFEKKCFYENFGLRFVNLSRNRQVGSTKMAISQSRVNRTELSYMDDHVEGEAIS